VLALDRCTDDTAAIARAGISGDERFEIIEIDACPDDWAGKVHAVKEGVRLSRGAVDSEYLLFADADTVFSPECIASALALMRQRQLEMLSLLSTLIYETGLARVVQTAAAFELMRQFPLKRVNAARNRRAFANGQFMVFTRSAYEAIGGHEAVKSALLEDLAFARLVRDKAFNAGVFLAHGLLHCDMYADWPQFKRGWKRIYTEAAERSVARLSSWATQIRWVGTVFPLLTLGCGLLGAMSIAGDVAIGSTLLALFLIATVVWVGALTRISLLSHAPVWTGPLHIIGAWLTANLLSEAAADLRLHRPTSWGGREYSLGGDTVMAKPLPNEVELASKSTATR
jgi:cellulose synthase/poly-beta-1,6-N-acetylglucosamine synthase-like glycosyltransferase